MVLVVDGILIRSALFVAGFGRRGMYLKSIRSDQKIKGGMRK